MKVHARKRGKPQQKASTLTDRLTRRTIGKRILPAAPRSDADARDAKPGPPASTLFGHDLSLIPAHSKTSHRLQTKLTVNAPGDVFEREADRVSERVTSMPEPRPHLAREWGAGGRVWQGERATATPLQVRRVEADDAGRTVAAPVVDEVLRSAGRPLDSATRNFMETRFGHDFSAVRVHTDARAAYAASAVAARAFTSGRDIVFGAGEYAPQTVRGRRILSHELTHVMQQAGGRVTAGAAQPTHGMSGTLQRQDDPSKGTQPVKSRGLDTNPARGATDRMEMLAKQFTGVKKPRTAKERLLALRQQLEEYAKYYEYSNRVEKYILGLLASADKSVTGDEPQSWGAFLFGQNTSSEGSTAAKPSKDVKYFNSSGGDLSEILEMGELLIIGVSKPHEFFTTPEDLWEKPGEVAMDLKGKIEEINKALEEEEKKEENKKKLKESQSKKIELLKKARALKNEVKAEADKLQSEVREIQTPDHSAAGAKSHTTAQTGQSVKTTNADSKQTKAAGTKSSSTSKPSWYNSNPMGYWSFPPLFAEYKWVSGDPAVPPGAIAIVTDKNGTKRKFRYWVGKDGYDRSELLETIGPTAP